MSLAGSRTKNNNIQSIVKAVNVINLLSSAEKPLSLSSMSTTLGMAKSTLHGIISTLVDTGLVSQLPENGHYQLSLRLFQIGSIVSNNLDENKIAKPFIQKIVLQTMETVHLAILDGGEVLHINKQEGSHSIDIDSTLGKKLPAHCTAAGKVLLSDLTYAEIKNIAKLKGLEKYTDKTITTLDGLYKEIDIVKARGYAIDNQEFMEGLRCVAVPIKNNLGKVTSTLTVSGPVHRMTNPKLRICLDYLLEAANEISNELNKI